jgi:hypothetical protein
MKKFTSMFFAIIVCFIFIFPASAQTPESIADTSSFKTGETVSTRLLVGSPLSLAIKSNEKTSELPIGTTIVLGIIVVLLIVGIIILVRILRSNDEQ